MTPPPHRLRLLMTTDAVGGVWVYAAILARQLCRYGNRVTLVTLGPEPRSDQLRLVEDVPGLDIEITDFALEWMDPSAADHARAMHRLAEIERRVMPDLIHLNSYREASACWRAPVVVVAHSCVRSWWRACRDGEPEGPDWATYIENIGHGLETADVWVAPTSAFRDEIQLLYRPSSEGRVVWNGIGNVLFPARKERFVLAAGRVWDEGKNIAALGAVGSERSWPIRVAGPLASPEGVGPAEIVGVECLGELNRTELLRAMQSAAIYVSPALYEPFGLTVLEAASSGCALVLSDIPAFRELWDKAALFVDAHEPSAVQAALRYVAEDALLRQELQHRALMRARRYSLRRMLEGYGAAYEAAFKARTGFHRPHVAEGYA